MKEQNIHLEESMEMADDMVVEGYDDCGSSEEAYECKEDCIVFGGPLISKIH